MLSNISLDMESGYLSALVLLVLQPLILLFTRSFYVDLLLRSWSVEQLYTGSSLNLPNQRQRSRVGSTSSWSTRMACGSPQEYILGASLLSPVVMTSSRSLRNTVVAHMCMLTIHRSIDPLARWRARSIRHACQRVLMMWPTGSALTCFS
jgi:hypothetical protein